MYTDLKDMLFAWVVSRTDEGLGYTLRCGENCCDAVDQRTSAAGLRGHA